MNKENINKNIDKEIPNPDEKNLTEGTKKEDEKTTDKKTKSEPSKDTAEVKDVAVKKTYSSDQKIGLFYGSSTVILKQFAILFKKN